MGCGQCHPATVGTHLSGLPADVDVDPATETISSPNAKLGSVGAIWTKASGTCSNVYCHSDGNGTFADVTNWNAVAGDKGITCASCHGNSPTTAAHGLDEVGIHYEELYDDDGDGLMATDPTQTGASGGTDSAHGNSATSTTITCYTCHSNTVTDTANADNTTCLGCHSDTDSIATGNELARIKVSSSVHLNGTKDVVFADLSTFKSKAQLRDNLSDAVDGGNILSNFWSRLVGDYKKADGSGTDTSLVADATWSAGPKTCSTASCHNNNLATWTDSGVDCMYCHTSLPK
jgi:predicted CxxxxCH...CXXCH cytochrome family protein